MRRPRRRTWRWYPGLCGAWVRASRYLGKPRGRRQAGGLADGLGGTRSASGSWFPAGTATYNSHTIEEGSCPCAAPHPHSSSISGSVVSSLLRLAGAVLSAQLATRYSPCWPDTHTRRVTSRTASAKHHLSPVHPAHRNHRVRHTPPSK